MDKENRSVCVCVCVCVYICTYVYGLCYYSCDSVCVLVYTLDSSPAYVHVVLCRPEDLFVLKSAVHTQYNVADTHTCSPSNNVL